MKKCDLWLWKRFHIPGVGSPYLFFHWGWFQQTTLRTRIYIISSELLAGRSEWNFLSYEATYFSHQSLEDRKDHPDEQHWPDMQPVIWQNEERRRSKQIRKEYFKVCCSFMVANLMLNLISGLSISTKIKIYYIKKGKPGHTFWQGTTEIEFPPSTAFCCWMTAQGVKY